MVDAVAPSAGVQVHRRGAAASSVHVPMPPLLCDMGRYWAAGVVAGGRPAQPPSYVSMTAGPEHICTYILVLLLMRWIR